MADEPIQGLQSFFDDLGKLSHVMAKTILVRAARKMAEPIEKRMSAMAPDDPETPGSQQRENMDTNVADQTSTGVDVYIGPTKFGFMAGFSELGTAHQPARPYLGLAFDETLEAAMRILETELGDAIEKALTKK